MSKVLTWYEVIGEQGSIDIEASIQKIQDSMTQRNPEKYGDFIKTLEKIETALRFMCIRKVSIRVELFKCVYYAMRMVDDIVDWDTNPPLPLDDRKKILDGILSGKLEDIPNPLYRVLSQRIRELSSKLWLKEEMSAATHEIIISMNYDLLRIMDNDKLREADDLHKNFHRMDITGTIAGTAIIFWIDPQNAVQLLTPLWEASRTMYNLRDFWEDIIADLINIPKEDIEHFWITDDDIKRVRALGKKIDFSLLPQSIKEWCQSEIWKISSLLAQHDVNMQKKIKFTGFWNFALSCWRNKILKNKILPRTYTNEIKERVPKILAQIGQIA